MRLRKPLAATRMMAGVIEQDAEREASRVGVGEHPLLLTSPDDLGHEVEPAEVDVVVDTAQHCAERGPVLRPAARSATLPEPVPATAAVG
jgi:hypothetical protein